MPIANRIWTINDISGDRGFAERNDEDGEDSTSSVPANPSTKPYAPIATAAAALPSHRPSSSPPSTITCCHLPTLSRSMQARDMMERILAEFEPIIRRRNYNIRSVSEFCCCGDGLDHEPTSRRKKRPKQSSNILGYNMTSFRGRGNKSHSIHLRLRHVANHAMFFLYEDVAGTMAHELAHCEIAPHNDRFFKLMDEIIDEHAQLMASKLTWNGRPMLAFGTATGQVLGGGGERVTLEDRRKKQQQTQNRAGRVLGGDAAFTQWMTPREAAVAAADARRRQEIMRKRGELCCRPCLGEDDEDEGDCEDVVVEEVADGDRKKAAIESEETKAGDKKRQGGAVAVLDDVENRKPRAKKQANVGNKTSTGVTKGVELIDLTEDDDDCGIPFAPVAAASTRPALKTWSCVKCTFLNQHVAAACTICLSERDWNTLY